ncbi:methyltransferase family protein [Stackebrandtia albiflava]|uniref:Methyltransferase family protein n=1 Tax=Stackebrandtia albiflava TaxID=406432 RepID=A0A562VGP2_9ACTN|nr:methyltransferase domain-containing protein [Stackebrandtia albiflava]TWJ17093.1 methyltransferase family protein [Stackebrandtia albiflava]
MRQVSRPGVVWSIVADALADTDGTGAIVDVGGGTGGFAVALAQAGHRVTVIDTSPNALADLTRRATDAGVADHVTAVQGDADALSDLLPAASARLVLCHSVLEMVDSPAAAMASIAAILAPGGAASLLVANRAGAVLSRVLSGHLAQANAILTDPEGRSGDRDTLQRRFDAESLTRLAESAGLAPGPLHGVHVVSDLMPGSSMEDPGTVAAVRDFEAHTATLPPYRDIAGGLHLLAHREA